MAKSKSTTPKMKKQRVTKYTKLALVCAKELAAKKKALVAAEKRLAKAQLTHQELLSEVARLDMLDRSLKAVNDKTQPPQNIKYVYTYPTWVWNPYYNTPNYAPNNGQWTFTTQPNWVGYNTPNTSGGTAIGAGLNGGSLLTSNGSGLSPTVTCTLANAGDAFTLTNSNNVQLTTQTTPCGGLPDTGTVLQGDGNAGINWTAAPNDGSLVVDLTTHEPYVDDDGNVPKDRMLSEETIELQALNA